MYDLKVKQNYRSILHIDADAFFASVEQALNPELCGKAVIVGGPSRTHGIVSTSSYEAKRMGVKSAMPIAKALRLCPKAVVVPGNFKAYKEYSQRMYEIFCKHAPEVEMLSIDEAFLDVTGCEKMFGKKAHVIARDILNEVESELGITVSCGMSSNKTVSKIVSSLNKPNKLSIVPFGREAEYLAPLSLSAMPGVGPKSFCNLKTYGLNTLGDLANMKFIEVVEKLGVGAVNLWKRAQGVDNRNVCSFRSDPKSISKERTFYEAPNVGEGVETLKNLALQVFERLRKNEMQAGSVCLKLRYKVNDGQIVFKDSSFQRRLDFDSNADCDLFPVIMDLFKKNLRRDYPIRLIGVAVGGLNKNYNLNLFETKESKFKVFNLLESRHALSLGV